MRSAAFDTLCYARRAKMHANREACESLSNADRLKANGAGALKEVRPSRARPKQRTPRPALGFKA